MNKPFNNETENKKFNNLMNSVDKSVDEMILSTDKDIMRYLEIVVSSLLLEINKKFPEPNYSMYIAYRIKSPKSDIDKLSDYVRRLKSDGKNISIKEISDLIGMRIIIEKIPYNITISKKNPEYESFQRLYNERKENIRVSEKFHEFEQELDDEGCTNYEYYTQSKKLLENFIKIFNSEIPYSEDYAADLKEYYSNLIKKCDKKLEILTAVGDFDSKINLAPLEKNQDKNIIDFKKLLHDFDSRINSKLALKLYSANLPSIIENSEILNDLGVSISDDPNRTKFKREKSGYVANFVGLDFKGIPLKTELQIMDINEHEESIAGYSAHSNLPGKAIKYMETPNAQVKRQLKELESAGKLKGLSEERYQSLKDSLYEKACKIFSNWASNISAYHAVARIDKDYTSQKRVKIYYDDHYERLSYSIREPEGSHTTNSIDSEYFLQQIYYNQSEWLNTNNNSSISESSIMDVEIDEYIDNDLPKLLKKISVTADFANTNKDKEVSIDEEER